MFKRGKLLGTYNGPAKAGEWILVEKEGQSPEGRYVLLQKNNEGLDGGDWQLHVAEFAAFGRYTGQVFTECEGRLEICQKIYTTQFLGKSILHTENA